MKAHGRSLGAALLNALGTVGIAVTVFLTSSVLAIMILSVLGTGRNQTINVSVVQAVVWKGMSVQEFCDAIGMAQPDEMNGHALQVSRPGILSLLVPQHQITAMFSEDGKLISLHVSMVCGAEENGWQIPLRDKAELGSID